MDFEVSKMLSAISSRFIITLESIVVITFTY